MNHQRLIITTQPKSLINITADVQTAVRENKSDSGVCNVFCQHTSCSLIISENADPDVLFDLNQYMSKIVPENALYQHSAEGADDMPAHIRSVLTASSITIPFEAGKLMLGRWQAIYLWEHRANSYQRTIVVSC